MTPKQLEEIESRWHIAPDFVLLTAALRLAWVERDEALWKLLQSTIEVKLLTNILELKEIELP